MKLVSFRNKDKPRSKPRLGLLEAKGIRDLTLIPRAPRSVAAVAGMSEASRAVFYKAAKAAPLVALSKAVLTAPIPRPARNIFCVGKNYHEHAKEFANSGFDASGKEVVPDVPVIFTKQPTSVCGPGDVIPGYLDDTNSVDYEGELTIVIGKGGRGISMENAMDHVFGYTIINDVTARILQQRHRQWALGKGLDGFCPMGPVVVTADEIGDPRAMQLKTWVNGELRQNAPVSDLIFDIPTLVHTISRYVTLEPGDLIATGTPAGVGIGFNPPKYLSKGDVVKIEISGIGILENSIG
jgi:2-keto-4-pentenoate hydratase/2-oxohepta-3-ene-1,7-dioic acid hydratase in catechol pathway